MLGRDAGEGRARLAIIAAALVMGSAATQAADDVKNVRLVNNSHRFAVVRALTSAARQLDQPECHGLLDEFKKATGEPLRDSLTGLGMSPADYLRGGVFFYDAPERACSTSNVAVTQPGSRAVLVCGPRFVREMSRNSRHAEALLIHEMLHSLGLGENPPASDEITARVRARCEGRERTPGAVAQTRP
jgi:hypothetical protein